jgi:hypothetical protein
MSSDEEAKFEDYRQEEAEKRQNIMNRKSVTFVNFNDIKVSRPTMNIQFQFKNHLKLYGDKEGLEGKHLLSEPKSMIGNVDAVAYKTHQINTNFHARMLHLMNPHIKFNEKLDNFFNARMEAHKSEKQQLISKVIKQH